MLSDTRACTKLFNKFLRKYATTQAFLSKPIWPERRFCGGVARVAVPPLRLWLTCYYEIVTMVLPIRAI